MKRVKTILLKGLMGVGSRGLGAGLGFAMNIGITHYLPVSEAGLFYLGLNLLMAISILPRFGFENSLIRFIAPRWKEQATGIISGIYRTAFATSVVLGIVFGAISWYFAEWLASTLFSKPEFVDVIIMVALALVPFSVARLHCGVLKGLRKPILATFYEAGAIPGVVLLAIGLVAWLSSAAITAHGLMAIYATASVLVAIVGGWVYYTKIKLSSQAVDYAKSPEMLRASLPIMGAIGLNFVMLWSGSLILGILADSQDVALYNVAHRTAFLISFIIMVANNFVAPRYAIYHENEQIDRIENLARLTSLSLILFTTPLLLAIFLFSEQILWVFGPNYALAAPMLVVIALGQYVNTITASVQFQLTMTGNENAVMKVNLLIMLCSIPVNYLLITLYGGIGAAASFALLMTVKNVILVVVVKKKLGVSMFGIPKTLHL
ncbi:MAG: oligosaccharide flippase family protein [Magnetococcales bacterium]|nr:oligosaccharide flippase family protein [Magnetococcales bacterium]